MIIDEPAPDPGDLIYDMRVELLRGERQVRVFEFSGDPELIGRRMIQVDAYALSYMDHHGCDLQAKTKLEPRI